MSFRLIDSPVLQVVQPAIVAVQQTVHVLPSGLHDEGLPAPPAFNHRHLTIVTATSLLQDVLAVQQDVLPLVVVQSVVPDAHANLDFHFLISFHGRQGLSASAVVGSDAVEHRPGAALSFSFGFPLPQLAAELAGIVAHYGAVVARGLRGVSAEQPLDGHVIIVDALLLVPLDDALHGYIPFHFYQVPMAGGLRPRQLTQLAEGARFELRLYLLAAPHVVTFLPPRCRVLRVQVVQAVGAADDFEAVPEVPVARFEQVAHFAQVTRLAAVDEARTDQVIDEREAEFGLVGLAIIVQLKPCGADVLRLAQEPIDVGFPHDKTKVIRVNGALAFIRNAHAVRGYRVCVLAGHREHLPFFRMAVL